MALVLIEGFDHYPASYGDAGNEWKGWSGSFWQTIAPRWGFSGQAVEAFGNHDVQKILPSSYSEVVVGFALKLIPNALWSGDGTFFVIGSAAGDVASLGVSSGYLRFTDSVGTDYLGPALPTNSWMYFETKVAQGSGQPVEVRMNGASVISDTGADFGANSIDRVRLTAETLCLMGFDDIYVLDTTGSAPLNDFLGDVVVKTLYPRADGTYADWTPLTGTDHFAMVDEHQIDGDVSYVSDSVVGDKDSYWLNPITSPTVYAAQLNLGARKGDAPLRQVAPLIRQGGTDYSGSTVTLSSDYLFYSWYLEQDPAGGDWTDATINTDEFGIEVIT